MMPIIAYNQYQAFAFWLNSTQAIIMNYLTWCPQWADQYTIDGEKYYLVFLSKGLRDMPTLDIKKDTMRNNINILIKKGVLKRKVIERNKPVYKVSDDWMRSSPSSAAPIKLKDVKQIVENWKLSQLEMKELSSLLSSYMVEKKPMKFEFTDANSGWLSLLFKERLSSLKIDLNDKRTMVDEDIEELKTFVVDRCVDLWTIRKEANGEYTSTSITMVVWIVKGWFNFHSAKWTIIKNIKASLNTWISNNEKFKKK